MATPFSEPSRHGDDDGIFEVAQRCITGKFGDFLVSCVDPSEQVDHSRLGALDPDARGTIARASSLYDWSHGERALAIGGACVDGSVIWCFFPVPGELFLFRTSPRSNFRFCASSRSCLMSYSPSVRNKVHADRAVRMSLCQSGRP